MYLYRGLHVNEDKAYINKNLIEF